ncbi:hypothetical protein [Sporisorium scitamineum]|uniref:Uncharacterized protein n=1 Tax=Sporisorium scitamineum TaxID=49012 RepID=A0A0F7RZA9_9BASI|nr:hypothetical protein [Sporisorium scitamineum]
MVTPSILWIDPVQRCPQAPITFHYRDEHGMPSYQLDWC